MSKFSPVTLNAYAKINLGLRILNKRSDGYHNIESLFHYISWHDRLIFTPSTHFMFTCSDKNLPVDENNLVVRSVREVEKIMNRNFPYSVHLVKNIPYGAGLGGGSSDAAVVLKFSLREEHAFINRQDAENIAALLGSDINFFLGDGTQIATDRGIILKPIDYVINAHILTIFPSVSVPTKWAYSIVKPNNHHKKSYENIITEKPELSRFGKLFINDFDQPISAEKAEIRTAKEKLFHSGADYISLSGSGSAVFGIFSDEEKAKAAYNNLSNNYPCNLTPPNFSVRTI